MLLCAFPSIKGSPYQEAMKAYAPSTPDKEIRALWITRDSLRTAKSIRAVVDAMRRNNLNTAIVQSRSRGDALYTSDFVPRFPGIEPGLDPLAEFIKQATPYGISVHAWVNIFLAADLQTLVSAPAQHLAFAHKDWFLKDRSGRSMLTYNGFEMRRLDVEGAFLDPSLDAVREYNLKVIREILDRYPVRGLHLDYIRYPTSQAGTIYDFGLGPMPKPAGKIPVIETPAQIKQMRMTRANLITKMVSEIRAEMRKKNPGLILSAAVWPNRQKIEERIFQMWPEWLSRGIIDYAFLMSYYDSTKVHDERIEQFYDPIINSRMVLGVGLYRNPPPAVTMHQLKSSRAMQSAGVCFFQANWFLSDDAILKEKRYQLVTLFQAARDPGFSPRN